MKGLGYLFGRLAMAATLVCATVFGSVSPAAAATVSKSFTTHSQASSNLLVVGSEQFTFAVSGTWVGTVKLQKSRNGADFKDVIGYEAVTANTSVTLTADTAPGQRTYYRVFCSTYTSGTIVTALADVADTVYTFNSKRGDQVFKIADDGVTVTGTASVSGTLTAAGNIAATAATISASTSATSNFPIKLKGAYTSTQLSTLSGVPGEVVYNVTINAVCGSTAAAGGTVGAWVMPSTTTAAAVAGSRYPCY